MDNQPQHMDKLIEDYIKGKLKGNALLDFEKLMELDPKVKEQVLIERELYEFFLDADTLDLKSKMKADLSINQPQTSSNKIWLSGLGLVIIIGLGIWLTNYSQDQIEEINQKTNAPTIEKLTNKTEPVEITVSENTDTMPPINTIVDKKNNISPTEISKNISSIDEKKIKSNDVEMNLKTEIISEKETPSEITHLTTP